MRLYLSSNSLFADREIYRLLSGYSRFPIHEPGNPLSFSGLLLVKKVKTRSRAIFAIGSRVNKTLLSSCSLMIHRNAGLCPSSFSRFCQRRSPRSIVSRHWTTCAQLLIDSTMRARTEPTFSQTGRAHLLLISNTPGIAGGAIGVITLEGML